MKWAGYLFAGASFWVSGCATQPSGALFDKEASYRLASVDGRPAGERSFTISFAPAGTYSASFDCADHFGRYSPGSRLVLHAGGTAPRGCDEFDLSTGKPVVRKESFGAEFLNDQPFVVVRRGAELVLTGRRHIYLLTP